MTYKVEILPTAWEDLKRIEDWYLIQFGVETALKVSDSILDAIERLETFPEPGSLTLLANTPIVAAISFP